ncbi:MAG: NAD-dependent dehydratase, partial [Leptolyngbya sp. SIO1D8]|nr:NAD-dependent dehydratase [Leptolyngbya sp. SIO1D8]
VVIVNPTIPIGPGDRRLTPPSRMVLGFLNGHYPAFLNSTLNLVDARDVAVGHILAAEKGRVGERYLLGNANLQLKELLQMLTDLTGLPMPKRQVPYWLAFTVSVVQELIADYITHKPPAAPLTGVRLAGSPMCFSTQKARQELGFTSRPLPESLADAIRWYSERGLLQRQPTQR